MPIRVLIVDDSELMRTMLKQIFAQNPEIEVIGEAANGLDGIQKAVTLKPDLITMDVNMPVMGGIEAIEQIMFQQACPILVISTQDDAETTFKAISKGALDLFPKSEISNGDLIEKVRLLSTVKVLTHISGAIALHKIRKDKRPHTSVRFRRNLQDRIVAIASSTGGPQALSLLLSDIPEKFPCPIVIAQHIAVGFINGLMEVLKNNTSLKVKEGKEGELLESGTVYLSPASKHMWIDQFRKVCFSARKTEDIYFPSCDHLLSSVAKVSGSEGIGIILTGMGDDGAEGIKQIKKAGGVTIAQDESTSIIFGMPKVAIQNGDATKVLPIQKIAPEILTLCGITGEENQSITEEKEVTDIKTIIEQKYGLFFDSIQVDRLGQAIQHRKEKSRVENKEAYLSYLNEKDDELKELVNLLTINESYFFRDQKRITLLTEKIIPEFLEKKENNQKIRMLSAGCSKGEEPFSLVMALLEKYTYLVNDYFSILAFDIDSNMIKAAKNGIFAESSFRNLDTNLRKKYFSEVDSYYSQISESVKKHVEFFEHNLLSETYPHSMHDLDIIFYQNVSIYFRPRTQKAVFEKLTQLLAPNGYLFLSSTEIYAHDYGLLQLTEMDRCFVFKKTSSLAINTAAEVPPQEIPKKPKVTAIKAQKSYETSKPNPSSEPSSSHLAAENKTVLYDLPSLKEMDSRKLFNEALMLLKLEKYHEALDKVDHVIRVYSNSKKAMWSKASILINLKLFETAKGICLELISKEQWDLFSYLLLGYIAVLQHKEEKLLQYFKEAIYIKPSCWLAHYYLGRHYKTVFNTEYAIREFKITVHLLEKGKFDREELMLFPETMTSKQIVRECKHNLFSLERS